MSRFTFGAVLMLAGALLLYFVAYPQWQAASEARSRIKTLAELAAELDVLQEQRSELLGKLDQVSADDLARLHALAPARADAAAIISALNDIAGRNRVTLGQINIGAAVGTEIRGGRPAGSIEVAISVQGGLSDLERFLGDLERSVQITDVSQISFSAGSSPEITASLSGTMYFRR